MYFFLCGPSSVNHFYSREFNIQVRTKAVLRVKKIIILLLLNNAFNKSAELGAINSTYFVIKKNTLQNKKE